MRRRMVTVALGLAFCTPALIAQRSMNSGIQFHGIPGSVTSPRPDGSLRGISGSVTDPSAATGRGFHGSFTFGNGRSTFVPPRHHRPPVYVVPYYGGYGAPYFYDYSDYEQQQVEPQQQAVQPQVIIIKEEGTQSSDNSRYGEHYFDGREGDRDSDHDQIAQSKPASPPEVSEDPGPMTTLVYRDGHKTEVRNYAIVGANLMDLTKTPVIRKIPLASLDLEATRHQNEENGVDFHLP